MEFDVYRGDRDLSAIQLGLGRARQMVATNIRLRNSIQKITSVLRNAGDEEEQRNMKEFRNNLRTC